MIILATSAVPSPLHLRDQWRLGAMLVADDGTPPESGEMTRIYARMAREDEAWEEKALTKAFRNSHPFVPAYRYLRVSRAGNSHHFRSYPGAPIVLKVVRVGPGDRP